jgi:hypothetical protein
LEAWSLTKITVRREQGITTIRTRPGAVSWLLFSPGIVYFLFFCALLVKWMSRLLQDSPVHGSSQNLPFDALGVAIVVYYVSANGRAIFNHFGVRGTLVVNGGTIQIKTRKLWDVKEGVYSASLLKNLRWEGKRGFFSAGKVIADSNGSPVVLAEAINDSDGAILISDLCEAYPFDTPEPAKSPAVVNW